jgi:UDP-N-acetylglucosamine 4,6-dehydratase/5-epimerase
MPKRLLLFSRDELKQAEMARWATHPNIRWLLGDVRDRDRLYRALDGVDVVLHAAALKVVPAIEYNPLEAVRTNVLGSANLIDAAIDRGISRVMCISTDKAVAPVNAYGATKLCMEKLMIAANAYSGGHTTRFAACRYGNVANSRGSVIPLWQEQAKTGTITITDPRMSRFWITLEQAVDFVLASLDRMTGGETYVPKLPSVRMVDVARAVAPDAEVKVIGIRPGEKGAEAMLTEHDLRRELADHYVIAPDGEPGPAYASDTNTHWLSVPEIRGALSLS